VKYEKTVGHHSSASENNSDILGKSSGQ